MSREERLLPALAGVFAFVLALRISGSLVHSSDPPEGDLSYRTIVSPQRSAPAILRRCSARFDGTLTRGSVDVVATAKGSIAGFSVEWDAFDRLGHSRATVTARYKSEQPIRQHGSSTDDSSIDFESIKSTQIDHVTCRLTSVDYDGGVWNDRR